MKTRLLAGGWDKESEFAERRPSSAGIMARLLHLGGR